MLNYTNKEQIFIILGNILEHFIQVYRWQLSFKLSFHRFSLSFPFPLSIRCYQEERMARLADIDANRVDRQTRRRQQRQVQTDNFFKSLHMLQANNYLRENDEAAEFEDYSIYMYRQNAPEFTDRVKELERKLLYPVRFCCRFLDDCHVFANQFGLLFAAVDATN